MLCPCCKKKLVEGKKLRIQTLAEHVLFPNEKPSLKSSFRCGNNYCAASHPKIFWDEYGDIYGCVKGIKWIDGNDGPFGSIQRQSNIEILKKDENKILFSIPFTRFFLKVEYDYKSNENGDILERKANYYLAKWNKNRTSYKYLNRKRI